MSDNDNHNDDDNDHNNRDNQSKNINKQQKDKDNNIEIEKPPYKCPDIINILDNFNNSANLPSAFLAYKPRSTIIQIEALASSELCKIKRYKNCLYMGEFINSKRHGKGAWKKSQNKGDRYEGAWSNDRKCGHGEYIWASGNRYKGNYFSDMRHGYGEMTWIDGSIYKGIWEKGIQQGEGQLIIPDEPIKRGFFNKNIFIGEDEESTNQTEYREEYRELPESTLKLRKNSKKLQRDERILDDDDYDGNDVYNENRDHSFPNIRKSNKTDENKHHSFPKIRKSNKYDENRDNSFVNIRKSNKYNENRDNSFVNIRKSNKYDESRDQSFVNIRKSNKSMFPDIKPLNYRRLKESNSPRTSPDRKAYHDCISYPIIDADCLLTKRELFKWMRLRNVLRIDPRRFKNLSDPENCNEIRKLINPPGWRPSGVNKIPIRQNETPSRLFLAGY